jgi:hypothetical protein
MVLAYKSIYFALLGFSFPMSPFFGRYLTGTPALASMLALAALDAYLAFALFHPKPLAWWIATVSAFALLISLVLTRLWGNTSLAYSKIQE